MMLELQLTNENRFVDVKINKEKPFFKILGIKLKNLDSKSVSALFNSNLILSLSRFSDNDIYRHGFFNGKSYDGQIIPAGQQFKINYVVNEVHAYDNIRIGFEESAEVQPDLIVVVETENRFLKMADPFEGFDSHFEKRNNVKVLFSGPFGQGKSTFLDYYFKKKNKYNCFKLFPVNYSVSHNEDIFKYIKVDLLLDLFSRKIEFDKVAFSYFETAPAYFSFDPIAVLKPLVQLASKVGKIGHEAIEPIFKLYYGYKKFHEDIQVNDEKAAKEFVKRLYETEGSIFEDNFYTQVIRQQLERLKLSTRNENVLIIEDLDRIDPEHIFRILNVFAAHFDTQEFANGYSNKFGFDKIILVGDYNNLREIYAYRYGPNVLFDGYISKYYTEKPFFYDNIQAMLSLLGEMGRTKIKGGHPSWLLAESLLHHLIVANQITLRDLLKLLNLDVFSFCIGRTPGISPVKEAYTKYPMFNVIHLIQQVLDLNNLSIRIDTCRVLGNPAKLFRYDVLSSLAICSAADTITFSSGEADFRFRNSILNFKYNVEYDTTYDYDYYDVQGDVKQSVSAGLEHKITFTRFDFFELVKLNIDKYIQVGGFT